MHFNRFEVLLLGCAGFLHHCHVRNAWRKTTLTQLQSRKGRGPEEAEPRTGNVHMCTDGEERRACPCPCPTLGSSTWLMAMF